MSQVKPHRLRDDDPHRLRCPAGHSGWEPINGHFWCPACEQGDWGREASFERVYDAKTGEQLDREDVEALEQQLRGVKQ